MKAPRTETLPRTFTSIAETLAWLMEHGQGRSLHLITQHDDWCTHGRDAACTCNPEFVIEELTSENLQRGIRGQRKWLTRHTRN